MKYLVCFLAFASTTLLIQAHECSENSNKKLRKKPSSERAENAKFVLANLAQMIGQIGTIIEEPKNSQNVESAVTNIVNNIVKITMHAVHNKHIAIEDAEKVMQALQDTCKNLDESITSMISVKKAQIHS